MPRAWSETYPAAPRFFAPPILLFFRLTNPLRKRRTHDPFSASRGLDLSSNFLAPKPVDQLLALTRSHGRTQ